MKLIQIKSILKNCWINNLSIFPNVAAILLFGQWAFFYIWDSKFNWNLLLWRVHNGFDHTLSVLGIVFLFIYLGIALKNKRFNWVLAFGGCLTVVGFGNLCADFIIVKDFSHIESDIFIPEIGLFIWLAFQSNRKVKIQQILKYFLIGFIPYGLWYMSGSAVDFYVSPITHIIVITDKFNNLIVNANEIFIWFFQVFLFIKSNDNFINKEIFINKRKW